MRCSTALAAIVIVSPGMGSPQEVLANERTGDRDIQLVHSDLTWSQAEEFERQSRIAGVLGRIKRWYGGETSAWALEEPRAHGAKSGDFSHHDTGRRGLSARHARRGQAEAPKIYNHCFAGPGTCR